MSAASAIDRLDRLESQQQIRELANRYAMAINARDIDALLGLFVEDVDCGRRGKGREALRTMVEPLLRLFYRSVHQVRCQVIDVLERDHAEGRVYGRVEHELGEVWNVQANVYFSTYVRRDGQWFFAKRSEDFFFSCDVLDYPQSALSWPGPTPQHKHSMMLGRYPSWAEFWRDVPDEPLAEITRSPKKELWAAPDSRRPV